MGADAGRAWHGDAVQVLAALEDLALRDLWWQTGRLHAAMVERAGRLPSTPHVGDDGQGALAGARTATMDALEMYSHAQGARAAAEQRARWRREEEDEGGDGRN